MSAVPNGRKVVTRPMNWIVCNSLPNFSSTTFPSVTSSEFVRASAWKLCRTRSGEGEFHMVTANVGSDPSAILCWKVARKTEFGELRLVPYPTFPRKPIVSEEKIDFSTEKPVLISATLPKPSDGAPARNDSVPVRFLPLFAPSALAITGLLFAELSSTNRKMGRFDTERSTHFQSSSSDEVLTGAMLIASNNVFNVTLTMVLVLACSLMCSRNAGRKVGAETFRS